MIIGPRSPTISTVGSWRPGCEQVFHLMNHAIEHPHGTHQGKAQNFEHRETPKQE